MTISLADNSPRDEYTLGAGATQQVFTVSFEFFDDTDLSVYVDGVEKTLGTASTTAQYVTANTTATGSDRVVHVSGTDGFIQFGAELTGASGGSKIVITRDIALSRTTDFPTSGPFDVTTLNTELDKFIAISADLKDQASRALQQTDFDAAASLTLPALDDRKGRVLAFNSSSGAVEAGPTITATQTVAAQAADIDTVAGISANVTTVAGIQANVTTVAGVSANVTTVAGQTANMTNITNNLSAVQGAAANATLAQNYAIKIDGAVESSNYSSKAWAIGGTGVTDAAGSGSAKSWAVEVDAVDGTEHSAKSYAISGTAISSGSAKQWALGGGNSFATNTAVAGGVYSARYYAEQAAAAVDGFDDTYLGPKSSDPSADNDGDALTAGDLYFNTSSNVLRVYSGSAWNDAVTDTTGFATNGFSIAMAIAL